METLKQKILEHIADLLDEPTFELDMRLADCIDPLPSDKSELHIMMTDVAFKVLCNYFGKQDNTQQYAIHSVINWVACSDRMPKHNNRLITWDGQFVQEGHYTFSGGKIIVPSFTHHKEVTHWAELPKPPCL